MNRGPLSLRAIPFKSLRAHPLRSTILLVLVLAQALSAMMGLLLVQSVKGELELARDRLGADILVYPSAGFRSLDKSCVQMLGTPVLYHKERASLARLKDNEEIERIAYQLYLSDASGEGEARWIVGFDPASDFVVAPWLDKGPRHLIPSDAVAVGADVPVTQAGTTFVFNKEWRVDSRLERSGSEYDNAVFVPFTSLQQVIDDASAMGINTYSSIDPKRDYSVALLRISDGKRVESVTNWINLYVRRVEALHSDVGLVSTSSSLTKQSGAIGVVTAVTWLLLLGALGVAQSLMMNERRREMSVWRIIGASNRVIARLFMRETLLIHLIGALGGVALAACFVVFGSFGFLHREFLDASSILASAGLAAAITVFIGWASARWSQSQVMRAANDSMLLMR